MKHCPKCDQDLNDNRFHRNAGAKDGLQAYCIDCAARNQLEKLYGRSAEELLPLQAVGQCAICGKEGPRVVDHDHLTGAVRDGLCPSCNVGLGHFRDDPKLLREAANYVEHHDTVQGYAYTLGGDEDAPGYWEHFDDSTDAAE